METKIEYILESSNGYQFLVLYSYCVRREESEAASLPREVKEVKRRE
jgi:hypothetical protein